MKYFASLVSTITEPMLLITGIALAVGWQAGLRGSTYGWYVLYLLGITLIIWRARIYFSKSMRTNWDVSDRIKRVRLLILLLGFSVLIWLSLFMFRVGALSRFMLGLFIWLLGFFLITLKTKISGHIAVATLAVFWFWPMAVVLPLVGWSRLVLKRHTPIEVIGGFLYSLIWLRLAQHFLMK